MIVKWISLECKKAIQAPVFLTVWILCVILLIGVVSYQCGRKNPSSNEYNRVYELVKSEKPEVVVKCLQEQLKTWEDDRIGIAYWASEQEGLSNKSNLEENEKLFLEKLKEIFPIRTEDNEKLLREVYGEVNTVWKRQEKIEQVLKNITKEIEKSNNSGNVRRRMELRKLEADYQSIPEITITSFYSEKGVLQLINSPLSDALLFLLLIIGVYCIMYSASEKEDWQEEICYSCKYGRRRRAFIQISSVIVLSGLVSASFFIANTYTVSTFLPVEDLTRPIQTISVYTYSSHRWNVLQLILYTFLWRWLSYSTIGCGVYVITAAFRNFRISTFVYICIWLAGYFFKDFFPSNSALIIFRYMNLYSMSDLSFISGESFYFWLFFSVLSYQQAAWSIMVIQWITIIMTIMITAGRTYEENNLYRGFSRGAEDRQKNKKQLRTAVKGELYKKCVVLKIYILFLVIGVISFFAFISKGQERDINQIAYEYYINRWERELEGQDIDLENAFLEEHYLLTEVETGGEDKYAKEGVVFLKSALNKVEEQYRNCVNRAERWNEKLLLFDDQPYIRLFNDRNTIHQNGALALAALLLFVCICESYEYNTGMHEMIWTNKNAKATYIRNGILFIFVVSFIISVLVYIPGYIRALNEDSFRHCFSNAHSIDLEKEVRFSCSILELLIIYYITHVISLFLIGAIVFAVSCLTNSSSVTIIISIILMLPYVLLLCGFEDAPGFGILPFISGEYIFIAS